MTERWKPAVGYKGFYEVSNLGRVRSVERRVLSRYGNYRRVPSRVLSPADSNGYQLVMLNASAIGKRQIEAIHRMVAAAFIGPKPSDSHQVNHIDGDKANNVPANLEWVTPLQNIDHNRTLGILPTGDSHPSRKLTSEQVLEIRRRAQRGESGASLGREYGVTSVSIYAIINGKTWKNLLPTRELRAE